MILHCTHWDAKTIPTQWGLSSSCVSSQQREGGWLLDNWIHTSDYWASTPIGRQWGSYGLWDNYCFIFTNGLPGWIYVFCVCACTRLRNSFWAGWLDCGEGKQQRRLEEMQVTGHWYNFTLSMSFLFLETFSNSGMCPSLWQHEEIIELCISWTWSKWMGWISHHEDFEFVLQGQVTATIDSGKAFHCLESKFYLKGSYG